MATFKNQSGRIRDKGFRLEFDGKDIQGRNGANIYTRTPQVFDHFLTETIANKGWTTAKTDGAGAGGALLVLSANSLRGLATAICSDAVSSGNTAVMPGGLAWKPSVQAANRPLVFEALLKLSSNTAFGNFTFGFGDATSYASDAAYVVAAASTLTTSVPNDAAVFVMSTTPTSGALYGGAASSWKVGTIGSRGPAAGTDTVAACSSGGTYTFKGVAPTFDLTTYHTYRIEVDVNGAALFFIDDALVAGRLSSTTGPRATVALAPYFNLVGHPTVGANVTLTLDYAFIGSGD